jgi:Spy/CpxP family protein refolding chaperone
MKRSTILVSSIVALGLAAFGAQALAQQRGYGWGMMGPGSGWEIGPGMMGRWMRGGMMRMMGCPMMGEAAEGPVTTFAEGRIAFLKAELAITDAQRSAWESYAEAIKRNLESMRGMWQTMRAVFEAKTPVERIDAHLAAMESRLTALKGLRAPLATLYEALSPDQRAKADEILTDVGCMM